MDRDIDSNSYIRSQEVLYLENSLTISIECKKSIIRRIVFCNKGLVGINYLVLGDKLAFQGLLSVSS